MMAQPRACMARLGSPPRSPDRVPATRCQTGWARAGLGRQQRDRDPATDWDAWGNLRSSTGSVGLHGFTGERADPTTNLVYLRARDLRPAPAASSNPIRFRPNADGTHGYNPYWYANNNPGTFTDPTGTMSGQYMSRTTIDITYSSLAGISDRLRHQRNQHRHGGRRASLVGSGSNGGGNAAARLSYWYSCSSFSFGNSMRTVLNMAARFPTSAVRSRAGLRPS